MLAAVAAVAAAAATASVRLLAGLRFRSTAAAAVSFLGRTA